MHYFEAPGVSNSVVHTPRSASFVIVAVKGVMNTSPTFRRNVALAAALVVVFCLGAISGSQSQRSLGLGLGLNER
jgi:hypothetical protein